MGNRAYVSLKEKYQTKTYYMHWNGGLDTIAPLCRVVFDNDIMDADKVVEFLVSLGLRLEPQKEAEARNWIEENGHYDIDLVKQTLDQRFEDKRLWHPHLKEAFEAYLAKSIRKECQDKVRDEYWYGIIKAGEEYFKKDFTSSVHPGTLI